MIDVVINLLTALINILPVSPIQKYVEETTDLDFLGALNYFIPFDTFLAMLESWIAAILLYMTWRNLRGMLKKNNI